MVGLPDMIGGHSSTENKIYPRRRLVDRRGCCSWLQSASAIDPVSTGSLSPLCYG